MDEFLDRFFADSRQYTKLGFNHIIFPQNPISSCSLQQSTNLTNLVTIIYMIKSTRGQSILGVSDSIKMKNNGENNLQFHVFLLIFLSPSRSLKIGHICVSGKKVLQRLQLGCLQLINKSLYRLPPNQHNLVFNHFSQSRMMPKNLKCKCDCRLESCKMPSTTMEKFKNDTEQEISFTSCTTIETVRNKKTKIQKKLDFRFRVLFTTRTDLRPNLIAPRITDF